MAKLVVFELLVETEDGVTRDLCAGRFVNPLTIGERLESYAAGTIQVVEIDCGAAYPTVLARKVT